MLILAVDDDGLSLEFMRGFLESEGHTVFTSTTITEAKSIVESKRPEVLLTDIELPDGTGSELALFARTHGVKKVIGITGFSPEDISGTSPKDSFHAILTKPIDFGEIQKHLQ